ncbi:MAG: alpha/beta fold hydrolase [Pseudomonadota bacterium]
MQAIFAVILICASVAVLEGARSGVQMTSFIVGETPGVLYAEAGASGPAVVVAHGFAGSQQMMQGFSLLLARAGYRVYAFDFKGHGRNRVPMSGDVTAVEGTTRVLVDETRAVIDFVDGQGAPVALLGHSMATDVLVRAAKERADVGPIVLVSAFSRVVDEAFPRKTLLITGAWEAGLRGFALEAARMVDATAREGETVRADGVKRRAVAAPMSEHVAVLQSRVARAEALEWLDRSYDRYSIQHVLPTGWAILGVLIGLVLVFPVVVRRIAVQAEKPLHLSWARYFAVVCSPLVLAPLIAAPLEPAFLPVLVADYLGIHLLIYGVVQLGLIWLWGGLPHRFHVKGFLVLALWLALFGLALDRYAANFWPTSERVWIMAVLAGGAVPYMVADAVLAQGMGRGRRLVMRTAFLVSLGVAVALNFEGLFFLIMIGPVLALFYLLFGPMAQATAARSGPLSAGLALGLMLAWALGVSFPLFVA